MAGSYRQVFLVVVALIVCGNLWERPARAEEVLATESLDQLLGNWDSAALRAAAKQAETPSLKALASGYLAFLQGEYGEALRLGREAATCDNEDVRRKGEYLLDLAASWSSVLASTAQHKAENLVLHVPIGEEDWASRIAPELSAWTVEYFKLLGATRQDVTVVFLADRGQLARLSGVPVTQLEQSGTVATTVLGRIVLVSPSSFSNGYPWHIVFCHELVHLMLHLRRAFGIPHYLEEGLASLLEEWSAYSERRELTSMDRALLYLAGQENFLLSREQLEQPFWQLNDPLQVRVAFMQALLAARELHRRGGNETILGFVDAVAGGESWESALEAVTGMSIASFWGRVEARWKDSASREFLPSFLYSDGHKHLSKKGRKAVVRGRETVLLGDLLWGRGHHTAALAVYLRLAVELQSTPDVIWRICRVLLALNRIEEAVERVAAALVRHPRDARVLYSGALVYRAANQEDLAGPLAKEAFKINPFASETLKMIEIPGEIPADDSKL